MKMKWVSSEDKPEPLEPVIFIFKDKYGIYPLIGWWDELNKEWVCYSIGFLTSCGFDHSSELRFKDRYVNYWMPMPELPKVIM